MNIPCVENLNLPAVEGGSDARRAAQARDRHWTMLWLSAAIVLLAFLLRTDSGGRVGPTWLPSIKLPEMCGSRALFGIECPGCGLTRSFIALAHGDLAGSLAYHRVGWLLALAVLLQFPYRVWMLREMRTGIVERTWPTWFGRVLIAALVGNWLLG
ncbi:MAG: DUF2752 domain-containing protein, partial [Pirellulales bacterium]